MSKKNTNITRVSKRLSVASSQIVSGQSDFDCHAHKQWWSNWSLRKSQANRDGPPCKNPLSTLLSHLRCPIRSWLWAMSRVFYSTQHANESDLSTYQTQGLSKSKRATSVRLSSGWWHWERSSAAALNPTGLRQCTRSQPFRMQW